MGGSPFGRHERKYLVALCAALALSASGCAVTDEQKSAAITDVNQVFRSEYEAILAEKGSRVYQAQRADAFSAVRVCMARLGMQVESQDPTLGFVNVYAPAPRPLDIDEWRRAADVDLPKLRELVRPHIGALTAQFIRFEPEGLQIVINASILEVKNGLEVSFTMRMREVAPPPSGMPRREYAPPTAVRIGLDKIWTIFEQELPATRKAR